MLLLHYKHQPSKKKSTKKIASPLIFLDEHQSNSSDDFQEVKKAPPKEAKNPTCYEKIVSNSLDSNSALYNNKNDEVFPPSSNLDANDREDIACLESFLAHEDKENAPKSIGIIDNFSSFASELEKSKSSYQEKKECLMKTTSTTEEQTKERLGINLNRKLFYKKLTTIEAYNLLLTAKSDEFSQMPPSSSQDGEVYFFKYANDSIRKEDWTCDQIQWSACEGSNNYSVTSHNLKVRYYKSRHGNYFFKKALILTQSNTTLVLVHHYGNPNSVKNVPHGNRKQNKEKLHIRTFPSTLKRLAESSLKPKLTYRNVVNAMSSSITNNKLVASALPRNSSQARNAQKNTKKRK